MTMDNASASNIGYGGADCVLPTSSSYEHDLIISSVQEYPQHPKTRLSSASIWRHDDRRSTFAAASDYGSIRRTLSDSFSSSVRTLERIHLKYLGAIAVLSWIAAFSSSSNTTRTIRELQHSARMATRTVEESRHAFQSLQNNLKDEKQYARNLEITHDFLSHEVRIMEELAEAGHEMIPPPLPEHGRELIQLWLQHRQEGLERRLLHLQRYIRETSRDEIVNRYGEGPHFVRFTVEMASVDSKNWNVTDVGDGAVTTASPAGTDARTFIVQLAPIDVMPHSVFFFLEMIRLRAWDDTFFHHQEKIEHVLTAVPMHCRTGAGKYDLLAPMGSTSLSFPEYSAEYPHEKYTLGFAYLGPHFYINSRSNVEVHGPGGQGHHTLPLDADACFGRVVDGIDVVDDLIRFGLRDGVPITMDEASAASSPWQYGTRIISIEIVPNT